MLRNLLQWPLTFARHTVTRLPWPGAIRRHPYWSAILAACSALLALTVYAITRPAQPAYITATAVRGDLLQTVEAVGTVISERDLALQFPMTGIVDRVEVREGDVVRAGQLLAQLRSRREAAEVASASARVQSARADLDEVLAGTRPEDIAIAEAEVESRKAQLLAARANLAKAQTAVASSREKLQVLEREAETGLSGFVRTAGSTAQRYLSSARTSLRVMDDVFEDNDVQDVVVRDQPGDYHLIRSRQASVDNTLQSALLMASSAADFSEALEDLRMASATIRQAVDVIMLAYDLIARLPLTSQYTATERETHKSTLAAEKNTIQAALSAVDAEIKTLQDESAAYDTRIAGERATLQAAESEVQRLSVDIATVETTLRISEAQLQLKKAGARPEQIAAMQAALRAAQADLARANAAYADTQLRAPMDGTVTKVHVKAGEVSPAGTAVSLLGNAPFRVEMFVSEIDIPKIRVSQSGAIELDAFPGVRYDLRVSEVDPAPTDVDGVTKYRVKLDFVYPHDDLKIGMTGDAEISTGFRANVISVPRRAVLTRDDGTSYVRILGDDGTTVEERTVVTGMEGGDGQVEVTGIQEGETVIVLIRE